MCNKFYDRIFHEVGVSFSGVLGRGEKGKREIKTRKSMFNFSLPFFSSTKQKLIVTEYFSFPNLMKVVVMNFYYKIMVIKAIKSIIWIILFSLNFGGIYNITMTYHSLFPTRPPICNNNFNKKREKGTMSI
jgi:hypothetical protein